jgi:hypothetical protein
MAYPYGAQETIISATPYGGVQETIISATPYGGVTTISCEKFKTLSYRRVCSSPSAEK